MDYTEFTNIEIGKISNSESYALPIIQINNSENLEFPKKYLFYNIYLLNWEQIFCKTRSGGELLN